MTYTTAEAHERILDAISVATDELALALACLGDAYERLDEAAADRLEAQLFRPAQLAYGRSKQAHDEFAARLGLPPRDEAAPPSSGLESQTPRELVEAAGAAVASASQELAELQDSMLPVEAGDEQLRAALSGIRELADELPGRGRELVRTLGR